MAEVTTRLQEFFLPPEAATGAWADARRLVVRTLADAADDRVPGLAAEMAFFGVLSLPPLLLVVIGSVGFLVGGLPEADIMEIESAVITGLSTVLSPDTVAEVLADPISRLLREGRRDLLSLGLVLTVWSASRATNVLLRVLIIAYDLEDQRPVWQRRGLALALTLAGIVIAIVVLPLVVIGPDLAADVLSLVGVTGTGLARFWPVVYWVGVLCIGLVSLTSIYHAAPGWHTPWHRDLPGGVLAFLGLVVASVGIRVYTSNLGGFRAADDFSALAAPLVLMVWVWASGISILMGAELNAEIERMWPSEDGPYEHRMPRHGAGRPRDVLRQRPEHQSGDLDH